MGLAWRGVAWVGWGGVGLAWRVFSRFTPAQFYPYAHVRSWENHGEMVIIEVARKKADGSGVHQEVVKVKGDDATCNAILKAIHTCISNLMERKKAEKAEKAAAAAAGAAAAIAQQAAPAAPSPAPPPVSQAVRAQIFAWCLLIPAFSSRGLCNLIRLVNFKLCCVTTICKRRSVFAVRHSLSMWPLWYVQTRHS
eukprot:SAG11_NODE_1864_length_4154_cov_1.816769_4_plen_195_part_00